MKQKLTIYKDNEIIFENKVLELPIKNDFLIAKSIEVFDDDDPCIIHQSFIVNEYVDLFLSLFKNTKTINGKDFIKDLNFIDLQDIEHLVFKLKE